MRGMDLNARFVRWLDEQIGSVAAPALRKHLQDRDYRLYSCLEHGDTVQQEVYHPERGFYRARGRSTAEALLGIMRQIWLVDALTGAPAPEVGPAADR